MNLYLSALLVSLTLVCTGCGGGAGGGGTSPGGAQAGLTQGLAASTPSSSSTPATSSPSGPPVPSPTALASPSPAPSPAASPSPGSGARIDLGPANGQTVQPLLGVNAGPAPQGNPGNADLTGAYQSIGVTQVRGHDFYGPLDMATLYPDRGQDPNNQGSYSFTTSDSAFRSIASGGFELYMRLGDSYNDVTPPHNDSERANWVAASVKVLQHYTQGLWSGFQGRMRYVQIWNEPDSAQSWPLTQTDYLQLYRDTARAVKAAFPSMLVGGPAVTPAAALSPQGQAWTRAFLDYVVANQLPLDFFAWHMYSNSPADWTTAATFYRGELNARGLTNTSLVCSEYNTDTRNNQTGVSNLDLRAQAYGAALMTAAWIRMQQAGVAQAHLYRGNDPDIQVPDWYGIFYADGRRKKVADAFQLWAEMTRYPSMLTANVGGTSDLTVLAGQDGSGRLAVLLSNTGTVPLTLSIQGRAFTQVTREQVLDSSATILVDSPDPRAGLTIDARTLQLLVLN